MVSGEEKDGVVKKEWSDEGKDGVVKRREEED